MRNLLTTAYLFLFIYFLPAVVLCQFNNSELPFSINEDGAAPDTSAIVDIQSDSKGLLIPRMPFCDIEQIQNPAEGLMIFDTEFKCLRIYIAGNWDCLYQQKGQIGSGFNLTGWSNTPLDEGFDTGLALDSQDNVYVTTATEDREIRLLKYDSKGNLLWSIFEDGYTLGNLDVDQNGNAFAIGEYYNLPFQFNGEEIVVGINRANFISKTTTDGTTTTLLNLDVRASSIRGRLDVDGNYNVAFTLPTNDPGIQRLHVHKYDNNLNIIWTAMVDINTIDAGRALGDIVTDPDANLYISGYHENGLITPVPSNDTLGVHNIYTVKFAASNGSFLWHRNLASAETISVNKLFFSNGYVNLFGNINLNTWGNSGEQFYDQRYAFEGSFPSIVKFNKSISLYGGAHSGSIYEYLFSVNEATDGLSENKILFYNPLYRTFENSRSLAFSPGLIEFGQSDSYIYGLGVGEQVGNVTLNHNISENNLVFKLLRD